MLRRIISGGQTGADRAALDAAMRGGVEHGGWCPKGRRTEEGQLERRYDLQETPSRAYAQRTEWNVRDADGTAIFTLRSRPRGGTARTIAVAEALSRPCFHLAKEASNNEDAVRALRRFVHRHQIATLNVAGSRESEEPGIYAWVESILRELLSPRRLAKRIRGGEESRKRGSQNRSRSREALAVCRPRNTTRFFGR